MSVTSTHGNNGLIGRRYAIIRMGMGVIESYREHDRTYRPYTHWFTSCREARGRRCRRRQERRQETARRPRRAPDFPLLPRHPAVLRAGQPAIHQGMKRPYHSLRAPPAWTIQNRWIVGQDRIVRP